MVHNYGRGIKAENYFASLLNAKGIRFSYQNSWYDYLVGKEENHKVEVKSTSLMHGNKTTNRMGRFQFYLEEGREKIFSENIWICFIIEYKGQFILMGLCKAKELKEKRFVSLCELEEIKLLDLDEWITEILKEEKK